MVRVYNLMILQVSVRSKVKMMVDRDREKEVCAYEFHYNIA